MLSNRLIKTAVLLFVLGVALGIYMGAAQDFRFTHVHAHINLLGWVALGLIGVIYGVRPALERGWLPHAHYWLHTIGLVIFMGGFTWGVVSGTFQLVAVAGGATMVGLGVLLLAIHVWTTPLAGRGSADSGHG